MFFVFEFFWDDDLLDLWARRSCVVDNFVLLLEVWNCSFVRKSARTISRFGCPIWRHEIRSWNWWLMLILFWKHWTISINIKISGHRILLIYTQHPFVVSILWHRIIVTTAKSWFEWVTEWTDLRDGVAEHCFLRKKRMRIINWR